MRYFPPMPSPRRTSSDSVVLGLCLVVGITYTIGASLSFLLTPMVQGIGLTTEQAALALAVPSIGSLLIVFLVGRLGDCRGHRRVIIGASVPFIVGGLMVALGSAAPVVIIGLLLAGASATAIQIASLGLLQAAIPEGPARIAAFTSFGMVLPVVYLVVPVLTGWAVGLVSWRCVPVSWMVMGLAIPALAWRLTPPPARVQPAGEWVTPVLAGLVLAALVQTIDRGHDQGWSSSLTLLAALVTLASAVLLAVLLRRMKHPSFTVDVLRRPTLLLLLVAVAVVAMVNTLNYVMLGLQYIFGVSVLAAAILLLPAQVTAILGAKVLAGALMTRWGPAIAGRCAFVGLAAALLSIGLLVNGSSIPLLVACASALTLFGLAAITIVNTVVMAQAEPGQSGLVSAGRGAASALGSALGVVVLGAVVSAAIGMAGGSPETFAEDPGSLVIGLRAFGIAGALLAVAGAVAFSRALPRTAAPRP